MFHSKESFNPHNNNARNYFWNCGRTGEKSIKDSKILSRTFILFKRGQRKSFYYHSIVFIVSIVSDSLKVTYSLVLLRSGNICTLVAIIDWAWRLTLHCIAVLVSSASLSSRNKNQLFKTTLYHEAVAEWSEKCDSSLKINSGCCDGNYTYVSITLS